MRFLATTALAGVLLPSLAGAGQGVPSQKEVINGYIYDYASTVFKATRDVATAVPNNQGGGAPINQFHYATTLSTPADRTVIRPNADTLYTSGWLNLWAQPIVLHVPDTTGRYYLIPIYDAYTNEFASIGTRTTGAGAGDYAIIGPGWSGVLPPGLSGVVRAPTNAVWALGRTLVRGPDDLANAAALTKLYTLTPLSHYGKPYKPPTNVKVTPPNPDFVGQPIPAAPGFSEPEYFTYNAKFLHQNPPSPSQEALALRYRNVAAHEDLLTQDLINQAKQEMAAAASASAITVNNWKLNLKTGDYGTNYALRAAVALGGFGANAAVDAVYPSTSVDGTGAPLIGANSYTIHFPAGQLPPAQGFWSITCYDQTGFLVANPINRYDVGSETGLQPNSDGSLDIVLQATAPATNVTNWLPTPAGAPFNLTLRIYWPAQNVLNGTYVIPPVVANTGG
jgi:hypothetical protein